MIEHMETIYGQHSIRRYDDIVDKSHHALDSLETIRTGIECISAV